MTTLVDRLATHRGETTALCVDEARVSYESLHQRVDGCAAGLLDGRDDLGEERIALLLPAGIDYVTALLGTWRAGGVAVPLNTAAATKEIEYALTTARATRLFCGDVPDANLAAVCDVLGIKLLTLATVAGDGTATLPAIASGRRAMMLFTSGTTSKPKGVVSTHANIAAQITALVEAWRWTADDRIPLFLPLHHIHGIVNVLCCALWAGARIDLIEGLDLGRIAPRVAAGRYTAFMAVPTVYVKLINAISEMPAGERDAVCAGFGAMRLMVSGSAACPVSVHEKWRELTGQTLLERYGMTEIGMALSNPYAGERRPGTVGRPLPGVDILLVDESGNRVDSESTPGEIWVRGANVFGEYWDNPAATAEAFSDGWFRTGDVADIVDGYYRILGRSSVDIIKSGGYKLSALEIESALLDHEAVAECAVVGIPDDTWGEAVHAAVVLRTGATLTPDALRGWCKQRMSNYKVPKHIRFVDSLPRNAMGKVTKRDVRDLLQQPDPEVPGP